MQGVKGTHILITRTCPHCGREFPASYKTQKFCSNNCVLAYYHPQAVQKAASLQRGKPSWNKGISNKVERTCETCGKVFYLFPSEVKKGTKRFCSFKCRGQTLRGANNSGFGRHHSVETIEKSRQATKELWQDPEYREKNCQSHEESWKDPIFRGKMLEGLAKKAQNPEYILKQSRTHKELWQDPEFAAKMIASLHQNHKKPEFGLKMAKISREKWQNPEYVAKMMAARAVKPTKPEKRLIDICSRHFPQYKYNGDCSLGILLGGLTPDFVNTNGRKEVIEVFGDYYHSPEHLGDRWQGSELGKIMIYNSLGWHCLVIWEHDLKEKSEGEIVNMVKTFTGRREKCRV